MLVSPGVSVTVTDDSFFIPASASTVPLLFVATASEKLQPDADPALGTFEYDVIRTVTSLQQSIDLYGVPVFKEDQNGNPYHGDARNEYGVFALNQFLGLGNRAFVVRANVNLNDDRDSVLDLWETKIQQNVSPLGSAYILESRVNEFLNEYNAENGFIPSDVGYRTTVNSSEILTLIDDALTEVLGKKVVGLNVFFDEATFAETRPDFFDDHTATPLSVYANGFDMGPTGTFLGIEGAIANWIGSPGLGAVVADEWSAVEARNFLIGLADDFQYTTSFLNGTSLGSNDAARRAAIVEALQSTINSNTALRSETYEFNLILCPGFPEVVDEMVLLSQDINDEAFVIADTPMNMTPEEVVSWSATTSRQTSSNVAYYYPHGLASNLDGKDVVCAASGIALRTFTFSDENSELWFAPAGIRRGQVAGISSVGYISGTLGGSTTFVEVALNNGQRDDLYKYFTNINPIVFFPGRGIIIWGQKTSAAAASALDRVNVSRLIGYIKRQLRKNTQPFIFEPNDQLTRDSLKAAVDGFLGDIVVKRGLYDFATICDTSNNSAIRIDRNEMYIDVALKPTKAAEFLFIPIRIVSTSEEI